MIVSYGDRFIIPYSRYLSMEAVMAITGYILKAVRFFASEPHR